MQTIIEQNIVYILLALIILILIQFILILKLTRRVSDSDKKLNHFMSYEDISQTFESKQYTIFQMLDVYLKEVIDIKVDTKLLLDKHLNLENQLKHCIQKVAVVRYNPFEEMGGDQCYAIAFLDEGDNGVVFNGLHNRSGSYTYAKPIEKGKSKYALSAEEMQALESAIKSK